MGIKRIFCPSCDELDKYLLQLHQDGHFVCSDLLNHSGSERTLYVMCEVEDHAKKQRIDFFFKEESCRKFDCTKVTPEEFYKLISETNPKPKNFAICCKGSPELENAIKNLHKTHTFDYCKGDFDCDSRYAFVASSQTWVFDRIYKTTEFTEVSVEEFINFWKEKLPLFINKEEYSLEAKEEELPLSYFGGPSFDYILEKLYTIRAFQCNVGVTSPSADYTFVYLPNGKWSFINDTGIKTRRAATIQEFVTYWENKLPKKITVSPKRNKYIGFRCNSNVNLSLLPLGIFLLNSGLTYRNPSLIAYLNDKLELCVSTTCDDILICTFYEFLEKIKPILSANQEAVKKNIERRSANIAFGSSDETLLRQAIASVEIDKRTAEILIRDSHEMTPKEGSKTNSEIKLYKKTPLKIVI